MVRVLDDSSWTCTVAEEGHPGQPGQNVHVFANDISEDYFTTLGIPLRQGRDFGPLDTRQSPRVVIVNETFNRHFLRQFTDRNSALGAHLGWAVPGQPIDTEIVGIVGDTKNESIREDMQPQIYTPYGQSFTALGMTGYVRSNLPPAAVCRDIQRALHDIDPSLPMHAVRTLEEQRDLSLGTERLIALLATAFAAFALLLTALGLYGVLNPGTRLTHGLGRPAERYPLDRPAQSPGPVGHRHGRGHTACIRIGASGIQPALWCSPIQFGCRHLGHIRDGDDRHFLRLAPGLACGQDRSDGGAEI